MLKYVYIYIYIYILVRPIHTLIYNKFFGVKLNGNSLISNIKVILELFYLKMLFLTYLYSFYSLE